MTNPSPAQFDLFGTSVAISGTRVVIGVPYDDTIETNSGIVYVYDLAADNPEIPVLTLLNPAAAIDGYYGNPVAMSGTRLIVRAYRDDSTTDNRALAYVYDLATSTPTVPLAILTNPAAHGGLGSSIAVDGTTVVSGNSLDDTGLAGRGAAYVFGTAPALQVNPDSSLAATVAWTPTAPIRFVLQYTTNLPASSWLNAPSRETNPVTISITNLSRFYRLSTP